MALTLPPTGPPGEAGEPTGHAFISYAHVDSDAVDALQQMLEAAGVRVWRDTSELWAGDDWRARIRDAITHNALVFIACFSRQSVGRETSHQYEELVLATEQQRRRRPGVTWLIPVRFDECDIPEYDIGGSQTLASIQRADIYGDRRDQRASWLVDSVLRILRRSQSASAAGTASESESLRITANPDAQSADVVAGQAGHSRAPVIADATDDLDGRKDASAAGGQSPDPGEKPPRAFGLRRAIRSIRHRSAIASVLSFAVIGLVIAVIVMFSAYSKRGPGPTPRASASNTSNIGDYYDCTAPHCYSIAVSPSSMSGTPYRGAQASMHLRYMWSGAATQGNVAHINSSLRVIQKSAAHAFMEEGIYDGWVGAKNTQICIKTNRPTQCVHFIYEQHNGGSSTCINSGCQAYVIYWADDNMSGATEETYLHIVLFTSPSPKALLYVDDGYNNGSWVVHISSKDLNLDYYSASTLNSRYRYAESIQVGGELDQIADAGACANTDIMTFAVWVPPKNYIPFVAQASATAHVDTSTFNGTQRVPGTNPGTWLWNVPTSSNPNGC
jgi:hypothetical protein